MPYAISITNLGRQYGHTWAVKDLNLNIEQGEVFGVLGPNGAGKTTTMRMLACLVGPSVGTATIAGYDIKHETTQVRKSVGILTDSAGLYESLSAEENLNFFAKLYDMSHGEIRIRTEHYLKLLGLWDRRRDAAGTFSSGMKQKLSMARALIHDPAVLLLDEPTSALDPEGVKLVRDFIHSLKGQGRTIVLCTHNLAEAQMLCDRVAIVKRTLLRVGTPRQLQTSLYGRQLEIRVADNPGQTGHIEGGPSTPRSMNDIAVDVAAMSGVGDVSVVPSGLLVSMVDPELVTPAVVRCLVAEGLDIVRVAEIEHTLERAYLDLVARADAALADPPPNAHVRANSGEDPARPGVAA